MEKTDYIQPQSLPPAMVSAKPVAKETTLAARLKNFEYEVIQEALESHPNTVQVKKRQQRIWASVCPHCTENFNRPETTHI